MTRIKIGVDESGTGAWAGPFTVAAVAVIDEVEDWLRESGVRDSKVLSKPQRAELALLVADAASAQEVVFVEVSTIKEMGQAAAHFDGVKRAVISVLNKLSENMTKGEEFSVEIIIDGKPVGGAKNWLIRGLRPKFEDKADVNHPAVSAASILAKHYRSERMEVLDAVHPGYGFAQHDGYGTAEHAAVLEKLGPSPQHRDIKKKKKNVSTTEEADTAVPAKTTQAAKPPKEKKMAAKKTTKKAATKAAPKKGAVKATKAVAKAQKSERYSRDPDAMILRLVEKIDATKAFAAHGIERATKFGDKKALSRLNKAVASLDKAQAQLA
jgi:ribonuclease HII